MDETIRSEFHKKIGALSASIKKVATFPAAVPSSDHTKINLTLQEWEESLETTQHAFDDLRSLVKTKSNTDRCAGSASTETLPAIGGKDDDDKESECYSPQLEEEKTVKYDELVGATKQCEDRNLPRHGVVQPLLPSAMVLQDEPTRRAVEFVRFIYNYLMATIAQQTPAGELMFNHWYTNKFKNEFYQSAEFRATYCKHMFQNQANKVYVVLKKLFVNGELPLHVWYKDILCNTACVASVGCGPGCDLTGCSAFFRELCNYEMEPVRYIGYDISPWQWYAHSININFVQFDVFHPDFPAQFPLVDIVIVSYVSRAIGLAKESRVNWWKSIMHRCWMIIVLDVNDPKQNAVLKSLGFFTVHATGTFNQKIFTHVWARPRTMTL